MAVDGEGREVNDVAAGSNGGDIMTSDLGKNVNQGAISEQGMTTSEAIQATQDESTAANKEMQEEATAAATGVDTSAATKLSKLKKILSWKPPELPKIPSMKDLLDKLGGAIKSKLPLDKLPPSIPTPELLQGDGLLASNLRGVLESLVNGFLLGKLFIPDTIYLAGITATWYGGGDFEMDNRYIRRLAVKRDITLVLKFLDMHDNYRIVYTGDSSDRFKSEMIEAAKYGAHENVGYYLKEIKKTYDDLKTKYMTSHPRINDLNRMKNELNSEGVNEMRAIQLQTLIDELQAEVDLYDADNRRNFMDVFGFVVELCKACIVYSYSGFVLDGNGVVADALLQNPLGALDSVAGNTTWTLADMFKNFPELHPSMFGEHDIVFGGRYKFSSSDINIMCPIVDPGGLIGDLQFSLDLNTRWTYMRLKLLRARLKKEPMDQDLNGHELLSKFPNVLSKELDFIQFTKPRNKNIKRFYSYMLNLDKNRFTPTPCLLKLTGGEAPEGFIYHPKFYERLEMKTLTTGLSFLNQALKLDLKGMDFKSILKGADRVYNSAYDYTKAVEKYLYDPSAIEYWTTPSDVLVIKNLPDLATMTGTDTLPGVDTDENNNDENKKLLASQAVLAFLAWLYPEEPPAYKKEELEKNFEALFAEFDNTWMMRMMVPTPYGQSPLSNVWRRMVEKIGGFKKENGTFIQNAEVETIDIPLLTPGLIGKADFDASGNRESVFVDGFNFDKVDYYPPSSNGTLYNPWVGNAYFYNLLHNIQTDVDRVYRELFSKTVIDNGGVITYSYGPLSLFKLAQPSFNGKYDTMDPTSDCGSIAATFLSKLLHQLDSMSDDFLGRMRLKHAILDLETIVVKQMKKDTTFNYSNNGFESVEEILHRRQLGRNFLAKFIRVWKAGEDLNLLDINELDPNFNPEFNGFGFTDDDLNGFNTMDNGGNLDDMDNNKKNGYIPSLKNKAKYKRANDILDNMIANGDTSGYGDVNNKAQEELNQNLSLDNSPSYAILDENGIDFYKGSVDELKNLENMKKFLDDDPELFDFDPANPPEKVRNSMRTQLGETDTIREMIYKIQLETSIKNDVLANIAILEEYILGKDKTNFIVYYNKLVELYQYMIDNATSLGISSNEVTDYQNKINTING